MKITGASYSQTAIHFGISETGTIANWNAMLVKKGVEAFFKPKGRSQSSMTKLKSSKPSKTLTREQQLEEEIKLVDILKVTNFPKSTYHYWVNKMKQDRPDQALEELILTLFKEHDGNYGYRRMTLTLRNRGIEMNHKKVYRLMKKLGLICVKYSHKIRKY